MGTTGPIVSSWQMAGKAATYGLKDMKPVALLTLVPGVLVVNAGSALKTWQDFAAHARARPGELRIGHPGNGTAGHVNILQMQKALGTQFVIVGYKGAGPAVQGLLGKQFDFMIDNLPSSMPYIQSGKLRALAVTSDKRLAELPDVPTMAEAGVKDMVVTAWFGLVAPAGTPKDVIDKLYAATRDVVQSPDIRDRFKAMGGQAGGNTPAEFSIFIDQERGRWKQIVDAAGLVREQ
jgi:tripartite-type tricarboxylate transporter receptor subunit TctC